MERRAESNKGQRKLSQRRGPGRPLSVPSEERRQKILQAAEGVFLAVGFGAATMDEIAQRGGMSKRTVYEFFDSKDRLFSELVDHHRGGVPDINEDADAPEKELVDNLTSLAIFIMSPRQIAIQRVIFAEYMRSPQHSQNLFLQHAKNAQGMLSRWIAKQVKAGRMKVGDPDEAADALFGMTVGQMHAKLLLLGVGPDLSPNRLRARIARSVSIFLAGTQCKNAKP
jgi:AcrR family transcriptional regulator